MTSRQVQWRRFPFFDKDTITEDITVELGGADVCCMHTAGGRLYLGDSTGKVTVSDGNLGGRIHRQAYSGPVLALTLAPEATPPTTGTSRTHPLLSNASSAPTTTTTMNSTSAPSGGSYFGGKNSGVVVTLGDDSVPQQTGSKSMANMQHAISAGSGAGAGAGAVGGGGAVGVGSSSSNSGAVGGSGVAGSVGRSPCVLKFWAGADMGQCIRVVDVAAQMRDGQQQRWANAGGAGQYGGPAAGGGGGGGVPRLTAFAVTPDASQVACGFSDGTALLLQGDLARNPPQPPPAPLLIQPGEVDPSAVTALHFSKSQGGTNSAQMKLLVGYDLGDSSRGVGVGDGGFPSPGSLGLLSYDTRTDAEPLVLDELGCREGCSAFGKSTQEMVIGRDDGVYFFSSEDRGGAAGFEGRKQHVGCLWNYILVVSEDARSGRYTINVYDMRNKLVAFHVLLPQGQVVKSICCQGERPDTDSGGRFGGGIGNGVGAGAGFSGGGGMAFFLTDKNSLLRLRERDTPSKLELLFRKNLYPMAISLAHASDHDVSEILGIYRMYGDHLYKKGDFEGAMQQYRNTIGHLDPSYVIRRFLDAQRIGLLTSYLEALHEAGQASSDHTTLLLNCHTKLKDVEKLDRFIHPTETADSSDVGQPLDMNSLARTGVLGGSAGVGLGVGGGGGGANFDVVTAVRVLKSAGHADHAAELARRHGEHDWFLRIQLERSQPDYPGALSYIASLPFTQASEQLRRRGKPLVAALPEETTGVLMALCTGRYSRKPEETLTSIGDRRGAGGIKDSAKDRNTNSNSSSSMASAEDFVHLYVDNPRWLRIFLMYVLREGGRAGPTVADTLLELLLREWATGGGGGRGVPGRGGGRSVPGGEAGSEAVKKQREREVMELLDNPRAGFDVDHALVLVQMLNFKPGQLYLYEKLYMTDLVLEHYVDTGDTRNMMRVCRKEGKKNPDVWVQVLSYLVNHASSGDVGQSSPGGDMDETSPDHEREVGGDLSSEEDETGGLEGRWDDVREMLALIERDQILPPLRVMTILSQSPTLPLWVTRDFLPRYLNNSAEAAIADETAAAELRESTNKMRAEIQTLRATMQSSAVAGARVAMELPTFMATDQGTGVSKTTPTTGFPQPAGMGGLGGEQAKIHDIKAAQARSALDHEQFFKGLEEAADGFGHVASYFGKGVIS